MLCLFYEQVQFLIDIDNFATFRNATHNKFKISAYIVDDHYQSKFNLNPRASISNEMNKQQVSKKMKQQRVRNYIIEQRLNNEMIEQQNEQATNEQQNERATNEQRNEQTTNKQQNELFIR